MSFRISALDPAPFAPLFALSDAELAARGAVRRVADSQPGFPCRVSLADAEVGEILILLNHEHLAVASPYRARHAIYVREGAVRAEPDAGDVPEVLRRRLLSVRAYDREGMMTGAEVVEGTALEPVIAALFADALTGFIHLHNAKPGCYAARVDRA